jgi:hypothetical protein
VDRARIVVVRGRDTRLGESIRVGDTLAAERVEPTGEDRRPAGGRGLSNPTTGHRSPDEALPVSSTRDSYLASDSASASFASIPSDSAVASSEK